MHVKATRSHISQRFRDLLPNLPPAFELWNLDFQGKAWRFGLVVL
jgi:hypothetical protein